MTSATWSWKDKGGASSWKSPTSPEAILLGKMAHHTKQIRRECMSSNITLSYFYSRWNSTKAKQTKFLQ